MLHEMNLNETSFRNIQEGLKTLELRIYDEKRKKIELGDIIRFNKLPEALEYVDVKVTGLLKYTNFKELFKDIDFKLTGNTLSLEDTLKEIYLNNSKAKEEIYGVLGIKIKLL